MISILFIWDKRVGRALGVRTHWANMDLYCSQCPHRLIDIDPSTDISDVLCNSCPYKIIGKKLCFSAVENFQFSIFYIHIQDA